MPTKKTTKSKSPKVSKSTKTVIDTFNRRDKSLPKSAKLSEIKKNMVMLLYATNKLNSDKLAKDKDFLHLTIVKKGGITKAIAELIAEELSLITLTAYKFLALKLPISKRGDLKSDDIISKVQENIRKSVQSFTKEMPKSTTTSADPENISFGALLPQHTIDFSEWLDLIFERELLTKLLALPQNDLVEALINHAQETHLVIEEYTTLYDLINKGLPATGQLTLVTALRCDGYPKHSHIAGSLRLGLFSWVTPHMKAICNNALSNYVIPITSLTLSICGRRITADENGSVAIAAPLLGISPDKTYGWGNEMSTQVMTLCDFSDFIMRAQDKNLSLFNSPVIEFSEDSLPNDDSPF